MAASFASLPAECLELIFDYLETPDLIALSSLVPTVRAYLTKSLPRLAFVRHLVKDECRCCWTSLSTTSSVDFTPPSFGAKMQALNEFIYRVRDGPSSWPHHHSMLIITKDDAEAHLTVAHLRRSGFRALLSHGFPSRTFLDNFLPLSAGAGTGLVIAVTSRVGGRWGHWGSQWPAYVVSLSPPKSIQDYLTIESFGGRWTWTFFSTSPSDLRRAWLLIRFLQHWDPSLAGRGAANFTSRNQLDDLMNIYPHLRLRDAR